MKYRMQATMAAASELPYGVNAAILATSYDMFQHLQSALGRLAMYIQHAVISCALTQNTNTHIVFGVMYMLRNDLCELPHELSQKVLLSSVSSGVYSVSAEPWGTKRARCVAHH